MSLSSQFFASGNGGTLKYQEFTSLGFFTPSAAMIAKGGGTSATAFVQAIGGGASGTAAAGSSQTLQNAGHAARYAEALVTVSSAVTVTIGSGGTAATAAQGAITNGNAGGDTTFGSLLTAKGGVAPGTSATSGACAGDGAKTPAMATYNGTTFIWRAGMGIDNRGGGGAPAGTVPFDGAGLSVNSSSTGTLVGGSATANTGAGGGSVLNVNVIGNATSGAGGSGWVRVIWWE